VRDGLSGEAIINVIKETYGSAGRRTDILKVIRAEKVLAVTDGNLRFVQPHLKPDVKRLPEALTTLRRRYSFTIRVRGFIEDAGEYVEQFVTVSTHDVLSRAELEARAADILETQCNVYGMSDIETTLWSGRRAGGGGVLS
jgi:hypothetical protein